MKRPVFQNSPSGLKFIISLIVVLISFFILLFAGTLFFTIFFDHSAFAHLDQYSYIDASNPLNIAFMKTSQIFQSLGLFIVPGFIIAFLFSSKPAGYLGFKNKVNYQILLLAGLVMVLALPFINFTAEINKQISFPESLKWLETYLQNSENRAGEITKIFLSTNSFTGFLVNLFMMALIPAFGEEIMFRGLIQQSLTKKMNVHLAIFLSAFIFSAVHMQFYGFIPRFLMGAYFGYIFYITGNLWYTVFAHFVNNGLAVFIAYIWGYEATETDVDTPYFYVFLSALLVAVSIFAIIKIHKTNKSL